MSTGNYSLGEIAYLLSLKFEGKDAEDIDVGTFRSQLASVTPDGDFAPSATSDSEIPTYVRWSEVRRARARVDRHPGRVEHAAEETLALELRLLGFTESAIAETLQVSQPTAHRRWRALLEEIALELGGPLAQEVHRTSSVPACLLCAQRPRARLAAQRVLVAGVKRVIAERQSSLCRECTAPERRHLLVAERE